MVARDFLAVRRRSDLRTFIASIVSALDELICELYMKKKLLYVVRRAKPFFLSLLESVAPDLLIRCSFSGKVSIPSIALLADNSESWLSVDLDPSGAKAYLAATPSPELLIFVKFSKHVAGGAAVAESRSSSPLKIQSSPSLKVNSSHSSSSPKSASPDTRRPSEFVLTPPVLSSLTLSLL